ncbi:glycoside hydrolase family 36 protein [Gracilimonas mengyeensis]|uniref:Alpha-galactosidase n=1 Tax=Gracilimonas mengyeensis TaxID=1302730 RepID=A0A521BTG8_9BACT|nr:glycoside hydrolase family 36 protein [Gracilimonas mengyeensis]SMO50447.1 alpha-galactosidase [Gracilimonas mengyeensis]
MKFRLIAILSIGVLLSITACTTSKEPTIQSGDLTLTFDDQLHTNVDFSEAEEDLIDGFQPSEVLKVNGQTLSDFSLTGFNSESVRDRIGKGRQLTVTGKLEQEGQQITKTVTATAYDNLPNLIVTKVEYKNDGQNGLEINGWDNNKYTLSALADNDEMENFWSFQSGTYPSRQDWVLPIGDNFYQKNYQGMNSSDYGGGTPLADVWRPDAGLAVGHSELKPHLVSLPVNSEGMQSKVQIAVQFDADSISQKKFNRVLSPGDSFSTLETFVTAHKGDFYASMKNYRKLLQAKGVQFPDAPETAYEPIWCAWGYERNFTIEQVVNTLPKVKELGFDWAVLDDGWQIAEGDWRTNDKFNETTMKEFVDHVHDYGLKAKLWWAPLAADPGSRVHEEETEMLLVNKKGEYQDITWWDSHYLNPALSSTKEYHKELVRIFMEEWGYDGLKIDGQHLNQVPPDYGHEDRQDYPEKSVEELPVLYKEIYDTALDIKPDAVVEICPCGASISSFITPFMNQSVSSDPLNSWQIRLKGKTYKALMGEDAAYYGDHVELSDGQSDFASSVGIGGVIGTKFTWPESSAPDSEFLLTEEREELVAKWMDIYKEYMLPKGEYLGELYDIGFDFPEAHAIEKDGSIFYAFYADSYDGQVELRGLTDGQEYTLTNYETGEELGSVSGDEASIETSFQDHVMIKASPK